MNDQPILSDRDSFDEVAYLRLYPDIVLAVAEGRETSAWLHYDRHGRGEGRKPNDFDADFYLRAYPAAEQEIAAGLATSAMQHYLKFGRGRGFLSNPKAPRPDNASVLPSRFGGLWPDLSNAVDVVQGKLEAGHITPAQAARLTFWMNNGYVILENAIPAPVVDRAAADLDRAYSGAFPDLKFECHSVSPDHIPWRPEINPFPAKALDIHHFSQAIRDLMFADAIGDFLGLLFDAKTFASQTLGFLRGSAQEGHQDSAYVAYTIPRQFAATWTALEDVTIGAGELFYYPGSHKFEDFLYADQYKSVAEAQRMVAGVPVHEQVNRHVRSLEQRALERGIAKTAFAAKKGDVLVWHADLVHGGNPVSRDTTRKSIVTHYCPKHLSPLFSEGMRVRLWEHNAHRFTSSHYASEPLR
ncbi:MAG: phytanoyl-CoA dioxygenase family protein [Acetobacteraceae bacterium]